MMEDNENNDNDENIMSKYFVERNVNTHKFITEMDNDTLEYIISIYDVSAPDGDWIDIVSLVVHIAAKELGISFDEMLDNPIREEWYQYNLSNMGAILKGIVTVEKLRRNGKAVLDGEYSLTSPSAKVFTNELLEES